jgi:ATP-dependent Clp protease, protease subunit
MPPGQPAPPQDVYGVFVDDINQATTVRIVNGVTVAMASGAQRLHIMFQSWGGFVGDGVMLYHFFRSLTLDLTLYNSGQVASAGVTAFLGAKHRIASPRSIFMLHKAHNSPQFATATRLERVARSLVLDDERSEAIWRERVTMPDELWQELEYHDLYVTGEDAVRIGIATELGDFAPPPGSQIYKV